MTPKEKIKASKFLSLLLRHKQDFVVLDENGWAYTPDILKVLQGNHPAINMTRLKEIVAEDDKKRYSFSRDERRIRANQGHSVDVDLQFDGVEPPTGLFHGTAKKTLWMIRQDGLKPMERQYVHLSQDVDTAIKVGKRHGEPCVIFVKAKRMYDDGFAFYKSENGVWLTKEIPVEYLVFEENQNVGAEP